MTSSLFDTDGGESDVSMEKDATEEELEKLVFGDAEGFHRNLKSFKTSDPSRAIISGEDRPQGINDDDLKGLSDADVSKMYVRSASSTHALNRQ